MSVIELNYAVKGGNGKEGGGRWLALHTSICPRLELWLDKGPNLEERRVWIKTVAGNVQSFRIVFIRLYQPTHLTCISATLKISCDGCLFLLASLITHYILYIYVYIYQCLEKKEMSSTRDAGKRIIVVVISARRPEPLHRVLSLQKLRLTTFHCFPARWVSSSWKFLDWLRNCQLLKNYFFFV